MVALEFIVWFSKMSGPGQDIEEGRVTQGEKASTGETWNPVSEIRVGVSKRSTKKWFKFGSSIRSPGREVLRVTLEKALRLSLSPLSHREQGRRLPRTAGEKRERTSKGLRSVPGQKEVTQKIKC